MPNSTLNTIYLRNLILNILGQYLSSLPNVEAVFLNHVVLWCITLKCAEPWEVGIIMHRDRLGYLEAVHLQPDVAASDYSDIIGIIRNYHIGLEINPMAVDPYVYMYSNEADMADRAN